MVKGVTAEKKSPPSLSISYLARTKFLAGLKVSVAKAPTALMY
jgi:hypothetical protein